MNKLILIVIAFMLTACSTTNINIHDVEKVVKKKHQRILK